MSNGEARRPETKGAAAENGEGTGQAKRGATKDIHQERRAEGRRRGGRRGGDERQPARAAQTAQDVTRKLNKSESVWRCASIFRL